MTPVVIALGSNVGDRRLHLRRALQELPPAVNVIRLSRVWETAPIGTPAGSRPFLNLVAAGLSRLGPEELLRELHAIEQRLGRRRRRRNEPRAIDLDLILHGANLVRTREVAVPHPRFRERAFVVAPLHELAFDWVDPVTSRPLRWLRGEGDVEPAGGVYDGADLRA